MTRLIITFILLLGFNFIYSQQEWTLERTVQYAFDNNLTVQQAEITSRNAELNMRLNKFSRLPNISGTGSAGYQFGRTIDPTTNEFNNTRIGFNSYGINGGVVLFGGNRINSQVKQSQYDVEAARLDADNTRQNVALSVATAFLNILMSEEQLANAITQRELSEQQLERTQRLIDAGQLAPNARLDLDAQIARNEQLRIEAQNAVDIAYLNLKQLLQLDPSQPLTIVKPEIVVDDAIMVKSFTADEVYRMALQNQPSVAAAQLRIKSSQVDDQLANAGFMPTLSLFGSLSTNYSSLAPDVLNPNFDNSTIVRNDPIPAEVNGTSVEVAFFELEGVTFPTLAYGTQLGDNFGQSLGLSLSVPIYNNHQNRINKERAQLGILNSELASRQITDQLKADVNTSITNFRASRNSYQAAERSLEAADAAFNDAQRRFDVGAINSFEYNNAANNLDLARRELTRARYQMLFNLKVVEFYLGQPLSL